MSVRSEHWIGLQHESIVGRSRPARAFCYVPMSEAEVRERVRAVLSRLLCGSLATDRGSRGR